MKRSYQYLILFIFIVVTIQQTTPDLLCVSKPNGFICKNNYLCSNGACVHKPLFPLARSDVIFGLVLVLGSVVAILCGSAGGLFYVPLLLNILDFEFKDAVPISKSFILTKNTIMLVYYLKKQHPYFKCHLISFNNFIQILPNIYIGISIGYLLYIIFPSIILSLVFCVVIALLVVNVFQKSYERYLKENEILEKERLGLKENDKAVDEVKNFSYNERGKKEFECELNNQGEEETMLDSTKSKINCYEPAETYNYLLYKIVLCFLSISTFMVFLFLNGKSSIQFFGIQVCSSSYWFLYGTGILIQIIISTCTSIILNRETRYLTNNDINLGVIQFTSYNCFIFVALGMTVGLISITFGLAGGFMANPFFIMIGFDPLVSVATATAIMEISSSSSLFKFIVNGYLQYDYAIFFCCLLVFSTFVGMLILNKLLDNFKRTSFISFGMSIILALACLNMVFHVVTQFSHAEKMSTLFEFKNYCVSVATK